MKTLPTNSNGRSRYSRARAASPEINVAETLKEIRRALIDADVNYKVAKSFTDEVKQKALGQNVLTAVKPGQMMTKIVRDELADLMGGTATGHPPGRHPCRDPHRRSAGFG